MLKSLEKTNHHAELAISSFLFDQVAALLRYDPCARSGEQDASSAMSAAAGRIWAMLGDRKLFDRAAVHKLRAELAWLTEALAPLSHSAPVHGRTPSSLQGPASGHETAYEAAYDIALAALESARYFRLVADLHQFCSSTPLARQARRKYRHGDDLKSCKALGPADQHA